MATINFQDLYQLASLPQTAPTGSFINVDRSDASFDPNLYAQLLMAQLAQGIQGGSGMTTAPQLSRSQRASAAIRSQYGGAGAGGGNAQINALLAQYAAAQRQANAANEARYSQILGGYDRRIEDANRLLAGLGTQSRKDIQQRGVESKALKHQDTVARGLSGTTVKQALERGVDQDVTAALARLDESLRREQLGYQTALSGDRLSFMERKNETGPDLAQLIQLMMALGTAA